MADIFAYVGVCPACHSVIARDFDREHQRWHKERDEPAGALEPFPEAEEYFAAVRNRLEWDLHFGSHS